MLTDYLQSNENLVDVIGIKLNLHLFFFKVLDQCWILSHV